MRKSLLVVALFCAASAVLAQENRLSPTEAAEGRLLLFDGESTFGWHTVGTPRLFKAQPGRLELSGGQATLPLVQRSFELSFEYQRRGDATPAALVELQAGHSLHRLELPAKDQWTSAVILCKSDKDAGWLVQAKGLADKVQDIPKGTERFPLAFWAGENVTLWLRNVKVQPLELQSLFNGKDLSGWKVFEGKKSKFSVQDGAINIQDGPGDLQTEDKYANFILQLECISNGKHLNSGVFFRCRPNEYQNGYEAQIRNQFTPEATQEYTIEEFDPKTRESLGKRKIKSTAFDFGTGAIYRRVPARKEVAKDREWFTLTIVASGNHLGTWVNGIQVTDWHDNRPFADNARNGCKLDAGHISLQGHDPTTNLSFRNIRIAELPR
jgi:hypothetical protein